MKRLPSRLYAIVGPRPDGHGLVDDVGRLCAAGVRILQLRWKDAATADLLAAARECRRVTREHGVVFLIDDRADVALACDADGVHLGQSDLPLEAARRLLGETRWIGVSTHDVEQARAAAAGGADYIGFGPLFATGSKDTGYAARGLEWLRAVRRAVTASIVAIGGIDERNAGEAIAAGADAVAMISALTRDHDSARRTIAALDGASPRPRSRRRS